MESLTLLNEYSTGAVLSSGLDKSISTPSSVDSRLSNSNSGTRKRLSTSLPPVPLFKQRPTQADSFNNSSKEMSSNGQDDGRGVPELNTFLHHSEIPNSLLPTARSSMIHPSSSVNSLGKESVTEILSGGTSARQFSRSETADHHKPDRSISVILEESSNSLPYRPDFNKSLLGESVVNNYSTREASFSTSVSNNKETNRSANRETARAAIGICMDAGMEGDSALSKVVLSAIWYKGTLGAAVYNTDTRILQLIPDVPESPFEFKALQQVFMQTNPDVFVTSSKTDHRFDETVKQIVADGEGFRCTLTTLPNQETGVEVCKRRLYAACAGSLAKDKADKESFTHSLFDSSYSNMIRAAGALLYYLDINADVLFTDETGEYPIITIEIYYLKNQVWISKTTLSSLKIINLADHPSTTLGSSYQREGFSLYALMGSCKTSIGRKKLLDWFLKPTRDIQVLTDRLDSIEYLSKPCFSEMLQSLKTNLGKLRNMATPVCRMKKSALSSHEWLALDRVLTGLIRIADICVSHRDRLSIFNQFPDLVEGLHRAGLILYQVLDEKLTRQQKSFTVKVNYDEELDRLTQRYRDLPEILGQRLHDDVKDLKRQSRSSVSIHYSSQLGCLLIVDITSRMERRDDYSMPNFHLEFITEDKAFYSCPATREISEQYGDVKTAITDRELLLMYQLQNTLLDDMPDMLKALDIAAQIDCLIALSSFCSENSYVRPQFNSDGSCKIEILQSRHPLLEHKLDNYVANNIQSGLDSESPKVTLLTGPNASGKSIYLKQVALLVYLAHIGCYVPAAVAQLPLVDAIHCHFQNSESVSSDVSTFTSDLRQISSIMNNSTCNSLMILDEFGKGTCPVDGAALVLSMLKHWLDQGLKSPHVFLSTHFHILSKSVYLRRHQRLSMKMMDTEQKDGKLVYLYELVEGAAKSSHAAYIAKLLEIPEALLSRGQQSRDQLQVTRNKYTSKNMLKMLEKFTTLDMHDKTAVDKFLQMCCSEQ